MLLVTLLSGCESEAHGTSIGTGPVENAVAVIRPVGDSNVRGTVRFELTTAGVKLTGQVTGLTPGKHGFHIHEFGDLTNAQDGSSAGGHYAPRGRAHGQPTARERHIGDLGNIEADANGIASIDMTDKLIELGGVHSILGRAVVVHAGEDTFGQPTGDAGDRVGFGVIGVASGNGN